MPPTATTPTAADLVATFGAPDDLSAGPEDNIRAAVRGEAALRSRATTPSATDDVLANPAELEVAVSDLIGDLLHLVASRGGDIDVALGLANRHFLDEVGHGYTF